MKHSNRQFGDLFSGFGRQSEKFSRIGACIGRNFTPCKGNVYHDERALRVYNQFLYPHELHPFTPNSDQDRISPYNINTISSRQVMRIKKNINWWIFHLIKYQILQTKIISSVWQRVRRIAEEIMGVKG